MTGPVQYCYFDWLLGALAVDQAELIGNAICKARKYRSIADWIHTVYIARTCSWIEGNLTIQYDVSGVLKL